MAIVQHSQASKKLIDLLSWVEFERTVGNSFCETLERELCDTVKQVFKCQYATLFSLSLFPSWNNNYWIRSKDKHDSILEDIRGGQRTQARRSNILATLLDKIFLELMAPFPESLTRIIVAYCLSFDGIVWSPEVVRHIKRFAPAAVVTVIGHPNVKTGACEMCLTSMRSSYICQICPLSDDRLDIIKFRIDFHKGRSTVALMPGGPTLNVAKHDYGIVFLEHGYHLHLEQLLFVACLETD